MIKIIAKIILFFLIRIQNIIIRCKGYCYKLTEAKIEDYYKGEALIQYYEDAIPMMVKDLNDLCMEYNQEKSYVLLPSEVKIVKEVIPSSEHHRDVEPTLALNGYTKQSHKEANESHL